MSSGEAGLNNCEKGSPRERWRTNTPHMMDLSCQACHQTDTSVAQFMLVGKGFSKVADHLTARQLWSPGTSVVQGIVVQKNRCSANGAGLLSHPSVSHRRGPRPEHLLGPRG